MYVSEEQLQEHKRAIQEEILRIHARLTHAERFIPGKPVQLTQAEYAHLVERAEENAYRVEGKTIEHWYSRAMALETRIVDLQSNKSHVSVQEGPITDADRLNHLDKWFEEGDKIRQVGTKNAWTFRGVSFPTVRSAIDSAIIALATEELKRAEEREYMV